MMQQKIWTPHIVFWALASTYIPIIPKNILKISWVEPKMESVKSRQSKVIISYFIQFFYTMKRKFDPPT